MVLALHGMGMHAGYFDSRVAPGLSLLEAGSAHGFTVWAPDRPGNGASVGLGDSYRAIRPQAELLLEALDAFVAEHPVGAGVFVLGHSYGAKIAIAMMARAGDRRFLGFDNNGAGIGSAHGGPFVEGRMVAQVGAGDRGPSWGPATLYPEGTISRAWLPLAGHGATQPDEPLKWPADFAEFAPHLRMPVRVTFGDHERWWPTDDASLDAVRAGYVNSPRVSTHVEVGGGHNLSLGWAARSYHHAALAFADECIALAQHADGAERA